MAANTPSPDPTPPDADAAAAVIRQKLDQLYASEPNAKQELTEAEQSPHRSKHQQFMHELSSSGKDLATIQTEWHKYYQSLPPNEQHQVWQEFYESQSLLTKQPLPDAQVLADHKHQATTSQRTKPAKAKATKLPKARNSSEIQSAIRDKITANGKLKTKHHIQSLLFGLGMGFVVVLIFLFGFFNEVVLAPFIQPSRTATATPIITSDSSVAASSTPQVIIPKINVQIPLDFSQTTTNEADIENALQSGVVHYPTTVLPGQNGNAAFFGHSSNNIFNKGKYKFAFVLLHTLVPGDTFYLTYGGKVYVYKVISKNIVPPSDVSVLDAVAGQTATATLITCDPPGTSLNRLIIVGQQISPDPSGNSAGDAQLASSTSTVSSLPGNGPTLWGRFIGSTAGKAISIVIVVGGFLLILRQLNKIRA